MNPAEHSLAPEILERFLRGAASREENREVVTHLLRDCPACAEILAKRPQAGPGDYDPALDRFFGALASLGARPARAAAPLPSHPASKALRL